MFYNDVDGGLPFQRHLEMMKLKNLFLNFKLFTATVIFARMYELCRSKWK